ncbi:MAG: hypothetical protein AAGE65_07865 [Planctomycetota bacterium]
MTVAKGHRLVEFQRAVQQREVGGIVLVCDSNLQDNGGFQDGMMIMLRMLFEIHGVSLATTPHGSMPNGGIDPEPDGDSPGNDIWTAGGSLEGSPFVQTGAPAEQEALYPRNWIGFDYSYIPDQVPTIQRQAFTATRFCGFDLRQEFEYVTYGISFVASGGTHDLSVRTKALDGSPVRGSDSLINFTTGAVDYFTHTHVVPADPTWDPNDGLRIDYNTNGGPTKTDKQALVTGNGLRRTNGTKGVILSTGDGLGGRALAKCMADSYKHDLTMERRTAELADLMGGLGKRVLYFICVIQDADPSRYGQATPKRLGDVVSATATVLTLDDATGIAAGDLISVYEDTDAGVDIDDSGSNEHRVVASVSGNDVTVTSAFSRFPVAGDVFLSSPADEDIPSKQGFKNTVERCMSNHRRRCGLHGLVPLFVVVPGWPRDVNVTETAGQREAALELADEHPDVVGVDMHTWMTEEQREALTGSDQTHPGAYFLANIVGRIFVEAAEPVLGDASAAAIAEAVLSASSSSEAAAGSVSKVLADLGASATDLNLDTMLKRVVDIGDGTKWYQFWNETDDPDTDPWVLRIRYDAQGNHLAVERAAS